MLLDHLVSAAAADYAPELLPADTILLPLKKATAGQTLDAQKQTSDWLQSITEDDDEILTTNQIERVNEVFAAVSTGAPDAKEQVLKMQVPEEVRASVAMLTEYQWKFVEQANELRSMSVAKIVKETDHPDARIRLKALELLGKVTEVALFTERVEVKKAEMSDEELEKRIKEKLSKYMGTVDVVDVTELDEIKPKALEPQPENEELPPETE